MRRRTRILGGLAALIVALVVAGPAVVVVRAAGLTVIQNNDPQLQYGGWHTVVDAVAHDGSLRLSSVSKDSASFRFNGGFGGNPVVWDTKKGPDQGQASVHLDGVSQGTFDEYAPTAQSDAHMFSLSSHKVHTLVITVLGTKNASSTGTNIAVDDFQNPVTVDQDDPSISYDGWKAVANAAASGGSYQVNTKKHASLTLAFSGSAVDWITALGPAYGMASVSIDGAGLGTLDLYSSTQQWQVPEHFGGLSAASHSITIRVLGTRNPSSTASAVVVDEFDITPILQSVTVTPANPAMPENGTLQFTATAMYSDGSTQDVTTSATWASSDAAVATVTTGGSTAGHAAGTDQGTGSTTISATYGGVAGQTVLQVTCRLHSNGPGNYGGLGQFYADCGPLGVPGNPSTYSLTMATEAADAWHPGGQIFQASCSGGEEVVVDQATTSGPTAVWSFSNSTSGGSTAGHVYVDPSANAFCPATTSPTWN